MSNPTPDPGYYVYPCKHYLTRPCSRWVKVERTACPRCVVRFSMITSPWLILMPNLKLEGQECICHVESTLADSHGQITSGGCNQLDLSNQDDTLRPSNTRCEPLHPAGEEWEVYDYDQYRCKYFSSHECPRWVMVQGSACANCVVSLPPGHLLDYVTDPLRPRDETPEPVLDLSHAMT